MFNVDLASYLLGAVCGAIGFAIIMLAVSFDDNDLNNGV